MILQVLEKQFDLLTQKSDEIAQNFARYVMMLINACHMHAAISY